MAMSKLNEDRCRKLARIRELGFDPYGGRFEGHLPLREARERFEGKPEGDAAPRCLIAGRIVFLRDIGKLIFLRLRDWSGELQVGLSKKQLEESWELIKQFEAGDIIAAEGEMGLTKTGELTVWAEKVRILSKALNPPPEKWHGLTDVEIRYRQRYVDLFSNPEVMRTFILRSKIVDAIRAFMIGRGYVEVETPMMQAIAGGAAAKPFVTHHNALDIDLYLRIAPELYLKRLLVGGMERVFELNRNFRNEGISPRHNPEFTMLEAYEAYGSWETMADLVEELVCHVAQTLLGTLTIEHKNDEGETVKTINLQHPWRRVRMDELVAEFSGTKLKHEWRFDKRDIREAAPELWRWMNEAAAGSGAEALELVLGAAVLRPLVAKLPRLTPAEQLVEVYEKLIEPTLIDPCFVTHVPSVTIPLARENRDDPYFADVYELAINGQEISPGYSELNDPEVQARHFLHQVGDEEERQKIDEDFLEALRYGMPPAGGMGLGIDRLIMVLTGAQSIRDVILFPLQRPRIEREQGEPAETPEETQEPQP